MDRSLFKRSLTRAFGAKGNLAAGAVATVASIATANPAPLIAWGTGFGLWVTFSKTLSRNADQIIRERDERRRARALRQATREREALLARVEQALRQLPFSTWVSRGDLPDYREVFRELVEIRERVERLARERVEVEQATEDTVVTQLDGMLGVYLRLVHHRIEYLQILSGVRIELPEEPAEMPSAPESVPTWRRMLFRTPGGARPHRPSALGQVVSDLFGGAPEEAPLPRRGSTGRSIAFPSVETRVRQIEDRIRRLEARVKDEPAAAEVCKANIKVLQDDIRHARGCHDGDVRASAQLDAYPDIFSSILNRISAAQLDPTQVTSYMATVVRQVEDTERFVASLRPTMAAMLSELPVTAFSR